MFNNNCEQWTGMEVNIASSCRSHAVDYPFAVDPLDFEAALVAAVDHTGYRLRYRNVGPHKDPSTKTGWA